MNKALAISLLLMLLISACSTPAVDIPAETSVPTEMTAPTAVPSPTATDLPPVVLTVCTTGLPETAFPYAGTASAAKSRLVDWLYPRAYGGEGVPRLEPVPVRRGQTVVDGRGELVTATEGVWVRPSGCRSAECAITWNGLDPLEMDQMVIDFTLVDGLTWTDGTPVTAADSVFSYRLASAPDSPVYGWAEAHTQGYTALDERTVSWIGFPGFASPEVERFFWVPLPAHTFDPAADLAAIAADGLWTAGPLSFGPFTVAEWSGPELRLVRDSRYPSGDQVLPGVDQVVLRALDDGAAAGWAALQDGTCDALDASFRLEGEEELIATIEVDGGYDVRFEAGASWTQLAFGIRPAEFDAFENPIFAQRLDYFADARTRRGIALCLDRESLLAPYDAPWPSFLPPAASLLYEGIAYDPAEGIALLEAVGWRDHDGDPATPRLAQDVLTVFNGVPLALTLLAGPSPFHQDLAEGIRQSLTACGVGVDVQTLSPTELYAPGPGGPLFGRAFDLALIGWQPLPGPDCGLYTSWAVPTAGNGWIGTNIAGLNDAVYDAACTAAALALPVEADAQLAEAEAAFVESLPSIPLTAPPVVEVWRR